MMELRDFNGVTVRPLTEKEYDAGAACSYNRDGTCTQPEKSYASLVVVGSVNGVESVFCTAHAAWDVGARIAAMGLQTGLSARRRAREEQSMREADLYERIDPLAGGPENTPA